MAKMKIGKVLWLALQYAKQDRTSLIDAYDDKSDPAVLDAQNNIREFERVQKHLFGTTKSEMEAAIEKMQPINVYRMIIKEDAGVKDCERCRNGAAVLTWRDKMKVCRRCFDELLSEGVEAGEAQQ